MPGGARQSLVGLLLSDRTVRQGLDTSRQGRSGVGERRKRRKKKEVGEQEGRLSTVVIVIRALHFWGHWEGCGRGEETTQASGRRVRSPPHLGQWGHCILFAGLHRTGPLGFPGEPLLPGHGD